MISYEFNCEYFEVNPSKTILAKNQIKIDYLIKIRLKSSHLNRFLIK